MPPRRMFMVLTLFQYNSHAQALLTLDSLLRPKVSEIAKFSAF